MKRYWANVILVGISLLCLSLLYDLNSFPLFFHERAGLIACGLIAVHIACHVRKKDAGAVHKNHEFYVSRALNAFTALTFVLTALSGALSSRTLFTPSPALGGTFLGPFLALHPFFASPFAIFAGLHLGLNFANARAALRAKPMSSRQKALAIVTLAGIFSYGALSIARGPLLEHAFAPIREGAAYFEENAVSTSDSLGAVEEDPNATQVQAAASAKTGVGHIAAMMDFAIIAHLLAQSTLRRMRLVRRGRPAG